MKEEWINLLTDEDLVQEASIVKKKTIEKKIDNEELTGYENDGWELKKKYKNGTSYIYKNKTDSEMFLNKVWTIFYKMGFTNMSKFEKFHFNYNKNGDEFEKLIDIVAMDDETCIFVDCYSEEFLERTISFTDEINSIVDSFRYLINEIKEVFGERKCKYILATRNIVLSEKNKTELINNRISYFDEENVDYYNSLVEHLGTAARFQLLGNLFSKTTIRGMDERVPAIEGKMGNLTYYSFLIEPDRLLKIGYVLHRNKANHDQMPTYQRLIKKDRLKSIREYVNNGGFFPNSLIISIDSKDGKCRFEKTSQSIQGEHSRVGVLYLPKEYQSAYIIDGQHRLYGYSESKYAKTDTLPVIAFVNLEKEKQVKMFMDINENQKPVSKTLRNILNIDLNWNSDNLNKRKEAVILNISQELGENPNSPLFGRVITGEDSTNEKRCITIEYLKKAIEKTEFFNKYNKKNEIIEKGIFDKIDSDNTFDCVYSFLRNCLQVIADFCKDDWEKGSSSYLTINNTIVGIIRVIGDIIKLVIINNNLNINDLDYDDLFKKCSELLLSFADVLNNLSSEKRNEIKTAKGESAKELSWRILQIALYNQNPSFINDDLAKYIEENCSDYNIDGYNEILGYKEYIISKFKYILTSKFNWEDLYIPEDLFIKINQKVTAQNIRNSRNGTKRESDLWDVIELDDICKIINYKSNWSTLFKDVFNINNVIRVRTDAVKILKQIQALEVKINNGKQITKSEYNIINSEYMNYVEVK